MFFDHVWNELEYRLYICKATREVHIELPQRKYPREQKIKCELAMIFRISIAIIILFQIYFTFRVNMLVIGLDSKKSITTQKKLIGLKKNPWTQKNL